MTGVEFLTRRAHQYLDAAWTAHEAGDLELATAALDEAASHIDAIIDLGGGWIELSSRVRVTAAHFGMTSKYALIGMLSAISSALIQIAGRIPDGPG